MSATVYRIDSATKFLIFCYFGVPPNLLRLSANGLVIGKILAAAPAAIPFKIAANLATENINLLILYW